jgi:hypothetical protein
LERFGYVSGEKAEKFPREKMVKLAGDDIVKPEGKPLQRCTCGPVSRDDQHKEDCMRKI